MASFFLKKAILTFDRLWIHANSNILTSQSTLIKYLSYRGAINLLIVAGIRSIFSIKDSFKHEKEFFKKT